MASADGREAVSEQREDALYGENVYTVIRRDVIPGVDCRPVTLCYCRLEESATDAIDEYALGAFVKAVPDWDPRKIKALNGAGTLNPLEVTADQWEAINADPEDREWWGGSISSDLIFDDDMPLRPDDAKVLSSDGSFSMDNVLGRTGDQGQYVRLHWNPETQKGGYTEFYYCMATPYIKEEMTLETPATRELESVYDKAKGQTPPQRGGDIMKGPVGDLIRQAMQERAQ